MRLSSRRTLAASATALAFFPLACISSQNATPPAGNDAAIPGVDGAVLPDATPPDTGTDAGKPDATVPGDAGSSDSGSLDAGSDDASDGASDASTNDGAVTVLVTRKGAPESGITIAFHDTTGAPLGSATTDTSGSVSLTVPAGGAVTAFLGTILYPSLVTFTGVQPGDALVVVDPVGPDYSLTDVVNLTFAALPGATGYDVYAGTCFTHVTATSTPFTVRTGDPNCSSNGTFPLLVVSEDTNGNFADYLFSTGNPVQSGQTLDLSAKTWGALGTFTVSATNAPATASATYAGIDEVSGGVVLNSQGFAPADAGALSSAIGSHPGYPDFVQALVSVATNIGNASATQQIGTRSAPPGATGSATFDLSQLLPVIQSATIDTTAPVRPTVSWTTGASSPAAAGTLVVVSFISNDGPDGGEVSGGWTLVVPPDATSVTFPALPASAGTWAPPPKPDFTGPYLWTVSADGMTTYDQARPALQAMFGIDPRSFSNGLPLRTSDGTIRLSTFNPL